MRKRIEFWDGGDRSLFIAKLDKMESFMPACLPVVRGCARVSEGGRERDEKSSSSG